MMSRYRTLGNPGRNAAVRGSSNRVTGVAGALPGQPRAATLAGMEAFTSWLTPTLLVALVAWLRSELIGRTMRIFVLGLILTAQAAVLAATGIPDVCAATDTEIRQFIVNRTTQVPGRTVETFRNIGWRVYAPFYWPKWGRSTRVFADGEEHTIDTTAKTVYNADWWGDNGTGYLGAFSDRARNAHEIALHYSYGPTVTAPCACPYSRRPDGSACGDSSVYSRLSVYQRSTGNFAPCYVTDTDSTWLSDGEVSTLRRLRCGTPVPALSLPFVVAGVLLLAACGRRREDTGDVSRRLDG